MLPYALLIVATTIQRDTSPTRTALIELTANELS
jgi:hypothetical protein